MISKKMLIGSIITILICLALGFTCAIIRKFDVVSVILLVVILVFAAITAIVAWREAVHQKQE